MSFSKQPAEQETVFEDLPTEGPDFLIDTAKVQARMNARAQQPMRTLVGRFRIPHDASQLAASRRVQEAIGQWIDHLQKDGKELRSNVEVFGPRQAKDDETRLPILGMAEYRVRAVFKHTRTANPLRIELDPAVVKRAPDHRLTLREAIKAWGLPLPKSG